MAEPGSIIEKRPLPNETVILVLGIVSIVFCGAGVVTGIIALVFAGTARKEYEKAPELYTPASLSNVNTGRVCAIIGLSLSGAVILFYIIYIAFILSVIGGIGGSALMNS